MAKESKGLLLYYSSAEQFFKMSNEELGNFIKKELAWYMGETDEPTFDDVRSDCMHSRIKEQSALRGYNAQKQRESRDRKKALELASKQEEPAIEVPEFNQDFGNQIDLTITKEDLEDETQDAPYTKEDWLNDIQNGLDDGSYQAVFDNWWGMFFTRRSDALSYAYSKIHRLGGRNTNLT